MKMNMIVVILSGFSVVATLVIGILGCLLSRCKSKSSYDTVMGGKTEVEKEEYDLLVVDGGGEMCNCNTGFIAMSWTVLEVLVTGVLAVVVIIMVIKGVMRTISILQERKQKKLLEKKKQQEETREQIRLEERNKLEAIESS